MSKDQAIGALMLIGSIAVIILYGYMIFNEAYRLWALIIVASIAVVGVMGIVAWIGYTMATTPPPEPIDFDEYTEAETETEAGAETEAEIS